MKLLKDKVSEPLIYKNFHWHYKRQIKERCSCRKFHTNIMSNIFSVFLYMSAQSQIPYPPKQFYFCIWKETLNFCCIWIMEWKASFLLSKQKLKWFPLHNINGFKIYKWQNAYPNNFEFLWMAPHQRTRYQYQAIEKFWLWC